MRTRQRRLLEDGPAILGEALYVLRSKWPRTWGDLRMEVDAPLNGGPSRADAVLALTPPDSETPVRIVVEAKPSLPPRIAASIAAQLERQIELLEADAGLVVAPWLSPKSREALAERGMSYIDLTGNVSLVLRRPLVALVTQGADTDPAPQTTSVRGLSGPKGGVIARTLADVKPPYTVTELAETTRLSASFVSRVLTGLEELGFIERIRRGAVLRVDVRGLVEHWTKDYQLFESNRCLTYVFPEGPRAFERRLAERMEATTPSAQWALTGSLGAVRFAPIAAPALGIAYVDRPEVVAKQLELLPADSGANLILAKPYDPIVYERRWRQDGAWFVSPSQLAADCLTGSGRMPNEGDALLDWMQSNEDRWRARSLSDLPPMAAQR